MAMSDCIKCWDTPCRCGHDYSHWTNHEIEAQIAMFQRLLENRKTIEVRMQPNRDFSGQYEAMVVSRETERMIGLSMAKIEDSGFIVAVEQTDGVAKLTLTDSGKHYTLPGAMWVALGACIGERVTIVYHHKQNYIFKPKVLVEPIKTESN